MKILKRHPWENIVFLYENKMLFKDTEDLEKWKNHAWISYTYYFIHLNNHCIDFSQFY